MVAVVFITLCILRIIVTIRSIQCVKDKTDPVLYRKFNLLGTFRKLNLSNEIKIVLRDTI